MPYVIGDRLEFQPDSSFYVYALCDPRDDAIRYVGFAKDPAARLRFHISGKLQPTPTPEHAVRKWIQSVRAESGRHPYMRILAVLNRHDEARRAESRLIREHRASIVNGRCWWHPIPAGYVAISSAAVLLRIAVPKLRDLLAALGIESRQVPYSSGPITILSYAQIEAVRASDLYRSRRTRTPRGAGAAA